MRKAKMTDPHIALVNAIIRADKATSEMALSLARLKGAIRDAVEYDPPKQAITHAEIDG